MEEEHKNHYFINTFLFIVLVVISLVLYAKYLGVKGLVVKEYKIESKMLPSNFSGLKIVHISDLIYKSTFTKEDFKLLIDKINILKPDIVVFTGDLVNINVSISESDKNILIDNLSKIESNLGKYAIYGDYDYSYDEYKYVLEESGFKILNNSYEEVFYKDNEPLYLVGLDSEIKGNIDLNSAFDFYQDDRGYIIVLVHEGNSIKAINDSDYEVDLILGGHSLNGSVIVPFYGSLFIDSHSNKYYAPYYKKGITNIYISSGLGTNDYQYRFNNKPSFNLYRLKSQS